MLSARTFALLSLCACIWGFQPLMVKGLLTAWNPVTINIFRWGTAGGLLLFCIWKKDRSHFLPRKKDWPFLLLMGLTGMTGNTVLQFTGLQWTTVTNSTLITATTPAVTAVLAFFLLHEHLTGRGWLGILLAFAGVSAIVVNGDLSALLQLRFNLGDIFCFLSQISWALYTLASKKIIDHFTLPAVLGWCGIFGSLTSLLIGLFSGTFQPAPLTAAALGNFLYITFLGGIAANLCWNVGVKNAGPSITSIFLNLAPVIGMTSGHFLSGDPFGSVQLVGALVIFTGVFLTTHQK